MIGYVFGIEAIVHSEFIKNYLHYLNFNKYFNMTFYELIKGHNIPSSAIQVWNNNSYNSASQHYIETC